jgi:hypothetical protein
MAKTATLKLSSVSTTGEECRLCPKLEVCGVSHVLLAPPKKTRPVNNITWQNIIQGIYFTMTLPISLSTIMDNCYDKNAARKNNQI